MAEALSVASGIAGLVSLGTVLVKGLSQYYSAWKGYETDVTTVLKSAETLAKTLEAIQGAADKTPRNSTAVIQITEAINGCKEGLQNLQGKYQKIKSTPVPPPQEPSSHDAQNGNTKVPPTPNIRQNNASSFSAFRVTLKNQSRRALYPFKESTLAKLREIIRDLVGELNIILALLNVEETRSVHDHVQELALHQKNDERKNIAQWISATNFATRHTAIMATRHPDTGGWLLNSPEFQGWIQGTHKVLFCPGIPGAGKTVMAGSVVDHLQAKYLGETSVSICYVYCDFHEQKSQTVDVLLASILEQLVWGLPSLPKVLRKSYMDHGRDRSQPSAAEMVNLFRECCSSMSKVFIVVDALDECDPVTKVFKQLADRLSVLSTTVTPVRLLATSRFIPEIVQYYEGAVSLEVRAQKEDVERYISGRILGLSTCVQRSDALRENIKSKLVDVVDGMFLLVKLHLDSIQEKRTPKAIRAVLDTLERGSHALDVAYTEAKERMERQTKGSLILAKQTLSWITLAERPMTSTELQHALAVEQGIPFDAENIIEIEDILSVCAGLVVLDPATQILRFFHFTAQAYFEKLLPTWYPTGDIDIARTCISYLLDNDFAQAQSVFRVDPQVALTNYRLLDFTCRFWGLYARNSMSALSLELPLELVRNPEKVAICVQVSFRPTHLTEDWMNVPENVTGLHLSCSLGLDVITERLLDDSVYPVDVLDSKRRSPLSWAAEKGREGCARLLLAHREVDPDSKDHNGCTPLAWAARYGHVGVLRALLERPEVEADPPDIYGQTPLSWASEYGMEGVVRLLLGRSDVSPDSKDVTGQTPFSWAARRGQVAVLELFLTLADVEVDSLDDMGQTPLSRAARAGEEGTVRYLLDSTSAEPDQKDNDGMTPLSWAAKCGHEGIVKLLVQRDDVDADSKDSNGQTPFWWAARRGHEAVVVLLSKQSDVDTDAENYDGQTPLSMAAECGMDAVVTYLADQCGANVESRDQNGQTPLSWAARCGQDGAVKLLKDRADVNTQDDEGRTPLAWAKIRHHQFVVDMLSS